MIEPDIPETEPFVEFVILADRAESINGKLYLMGGGWDRTFVQDFSQPVNLNFAVGIWVPWGATNTEHSLTGRLVDEDDIEVASLRIGFTAGTAPMVKRTESQRVLFAFGTASVLPRPGPYKFLATVDDNGQTMVRTRFYALQAAAPPNPLMNQ